MDKEARKTKLNDKKERYYSLENELNSIQFRLLEVKKYKGHSAALKNLLIAVDLMREQIRNDYYRYEKQLGRRDQFNEIAALQKSLNRERAKREELEKQVREASASGSLFIKYVRDKLGI